MLRVTLSVVSVTQAFAQGTLNLSQPGGFTAALDIEAGSFLLEQRQQAL
jgi:hypothetical protein